MSAAAHKIDWAILGFIVGFCRAVELYDKGNLYWFGIGVGGCFSWLDIIRTQSFQKPLIEECALSYIGIPITQTPNVPLFRALMVSIRWYLGTPRGVVWGF